MPRPPSEKVLRIEKELHDRLRSGLLRPGDTFFSNRSLARRYAISYQTAHRLLEQFAAQGLIHRRTGAGTVVAGSPRRFSRVVLIFHTRARRKGSYGQHLHALLTSQLKAHRIPYTTRYKDTAPPVSKDAFPVIWEIQELPQAVRALARPCLVLNNHPPLGLSSRWVDSLSIDDASGGRAAGELLADVFRCQHVAALGGPRNDTRSQLRLAGFHSIWPHAHTYHAGSWGDTIPPQILHTIATLRLDGLFCANDRLASRLRREPPWPHTPPAIVGFDDAPIAAEQSITTIAIPWEQVVSTAIDIIRDRLNGSNTPAIHRVLPPQPILRG